MLSNLISQLKQAGASDKHRRSRRSAESSCGSRYPPLVTPSSQIVGTQAVLNVLQGERYKMVTKETKGVLRGEYGKLPSSRTPKSSRKSSATRNALPAVPPILSHRA
ncbi:MAG: hypothetical protein ACLUSP_03640 [Christensenellales bacterium]